VADDLQIGEVVSLAIRAVPAVGMNARIVADHAVVVVGEVLRLHCFEEESDVFVVFLRPAVEIVSISGE